MLISCDAVFFQFVCFLIFLGICFDIYLDHLKSLILISFAWKVLLCQEPRFLPLFSYTFIWFKYLVCTGFLLILHVDLWRTGMHLPIQKQIVCFSNYLDFPKNLLVKACGPYIGLWSLHFFFPVLVCNYIYQRNFILHWKSSLLFGKACFFLRGRFDSIHWISWTPLFII